MGKMTSAIISDDLKASKQCAEAVKKVNKSIGFIRGAFEFKSKIILTLQVIGASSLEVLRSIWSPDLKKKKDIA